MGNCGRERKNILLVIREPATTLPYVTEGTADVSKLILRWKDYLGLFGGSNVIKEVEWRIPRRKETDQSQRKRFEDESVDWSDGAMSQGRQVAFSS